MRIHLYYKLWLILLSLAIPMAYAGVYQCIDEKGGIEFRDAPCKTSLQAQEFLPIEYSKSNSKNIKKQQKTLEKNIKQQKLSQNREQRAKTRSEKQKIKAENKNQRRQEQCARVKDKIKMIEDQLRAGTKLKRFNRLKAELEHCERMKQRYCSLE